MTAKLGSLMDFENRMSLAGEEENRLLKEKIRDLEEKLVSQEKFHRETLSNKKKDLRLAVNLLEKGKYTLLEERKFKKSLEKKLEIYEANQKCCETKIDWCKKKIECFEEKVERYETKIECHENELVSINAKLVCSEIKKASYEQRLLHHHREEKQHKTHSDFFEKYLLPSPSPSKDSGAAVIENTLERNLDCQTKNLIDNNTGYIIGNTNDGKFEDVSGENTHHQKVENNGKEMMVICDGKTVVDDDYIEACKKEIQASMELCDMIYWLDRLQPDSPTLSSTTPTIKIPTIDSLIRRREKQDNQKRAWLNKANIGDCSDNYNKTEGIIGYRLPY